MIITLYGPDDYRRGKKLREIRNEFQKKHPQGSVMRFDFEEKETAMRFREFADTQSMFEPVKLAVLENLFAEPPKDFAKVLKAIAERSQFILIISEKNKPTGTLAFLAKSKDAKEIQIQEFEFLKDAAWRSFVQGEAKERGVNLSADALRFLSETYNRNPWGVVTELEKLTGLSKKIIEQKDLEALGLETAPDFWGVMNGLKNALPARRLATLYELLADHEPGAKIFHMIAYQWPEKLEALAAYDRAVKSGKLEYEEVLTDLAIG